MAYLHRDGVNGVLRPRRGARLAALTSGGAIAEVGDYRVIAEPDDTPVGSVNEDFAIESMAGDVFLLGTHSWRIRRVTQGEVRVQDAEGANPTIPFWVGEAPSRTAELSAEVSTLRGAVGALLTDSGASGEAHQSSSASPAGFEAAVAHVAGSCGIATDAARQLVSYLAAGLGELGVLPTQDDIVFERFFDEAGGMQLVVHAPFGGRINKGLGLALRKRFCATFDFELQAAATDDAVVLSLGPQHSFPLESASKLLHSSTAEQSLTQAVLASPMFASRWRWNLNRSLAVLRFRGGKKNPLPIQRMESDDLMAAVFPALAACQENAVAGPIVIPDHVLVRQTIARLPPRSHGRRRPHRPAENHGVRGDAHRTSWNPSSLRCCRTRSSTASPTRSSTTPPSRSAAPGPCRCAVGSHCRRDSGAARRGRCRPGARRGRPGAA